MRETGPEEMVDLKVSSNDSAVESFSKMEVDIFGKSAELFNGTNSLEANISLGLEEPFVIQNGKVKSIDCIEDLAGISTKLCPLLLV